MVIPPARPQQTVLGAIQQELRDAFEPMLVVARIRVTVEAFAGSPVSVPISDERTRLMTATRALDRTPRDLWREILVHPEDWKALLLEKVDGTYVVTPQTTVLGVPVVHA